MPFVTITQTEIDNLADIVWWFKGYQRGSKDNWENCDFDERHLKTLEKLMPQLKGLEDTPASKERKKISEQIAEELFTNGTGEKARRLVLELEDGADGGGWSKKAVIDRINSILRA